MKTKQDFLNRRQRGYLALSLIWWVWPTLSSIFFVIGSFILLSGNSFRHYWFICIPISVTSALGMSLLLLLNDRFRYGRIRDIKKKLEKLNEKIKEHEALYKQNTENKSPKDFDVITANRPKEIKKIMSKIAKKQAYLEMIGS